jgi:Short C-terminal domain
MIGRRGPGLVGMAARTAVVAGTATAVSGRVARRQQRKYGEQDAAYTEQLAAGAGAGVEQSYAQAAPAEPDYMAELEQLAQLKNQGILTEEEFQAKKKQLLGL